MTVVYWTRLSLAEIRAGTETIRSLLTPEECAKANRFVREEDRLLSLGGAYLIRRLIGTDATLRCSSFGKPYAEGVWFNLSHSVDMTALAWCRTHEVGFDIEKKREGFDELIPYCLAKSERASQESFLSLFCAKESLGKAEGEGLTNKPDSVPALPISGRVLYRGAVYYRHPVWDDSYVISVCCKGSDFTLKEEPIYAF